MSKEVDERIVQLLFENKQFEQGAKQSLSTIASLRQGLSFDHLKLDGLEAIQNGIDKINERFTLFGQISQQVISRVASGVVNLGEKLVEGLTIEGVRSGWEEYGLKLDSVQNIMNGTGESMERVNQKLDELNHYADKTIYSFSDMTSNIGKFTNAGVGLDDAVAAIQGVANVAAVSGANAQQASHAMYNFAQALSSGAVKLIDWKSIENAQMATVEFKNELIKTALELGTLEKEGDKYITTTTDLQGKISDAFDATSMFNDSLSHQWMTTEVLTKTLARYSDETTAIGKKAAKAATEVKTFHQLIDTLKEAVGSGWASSFEIVVGNFEESKALWTAVNNEIDPIISKMTDARNELLQGWKDAGGRTSLIQGIRNGWEMVLAVSTKVGESFRDIFPPVTVETLVGLTTRFEQFAASLKPGEELLNNLKGTLDGVFSVAKLGMDIFGGLARAVSPLVDDFANFAKSALGVTSSLGGYIQSVEKAVNKSDTFYNAFSKVVDIFRTFAGGAAAAFGVFIEKLEQFTGFNFHMPSLEELRQAVNRIKDTFSAAGEKFDSFTQSAMEFFHVDFKLPEIKSFADILEKLKATLKPVADGFSSAAESVRKFVGSFDLGEKVTSVLRTVFTALSTAAEYIRSRFPAVTENIRKFFASFQDGTALQVVQSLLTSGILLKLIEFIKSLKDVTGGFGDIVSNFADVLEGVTGALEGMQNKLNSEALKNLAVSLGILAGSILVLASIDKDSLTSAASAIGGLMAELVLAMTAFNKFGGGGATKGGGLLAMFGLGGGSDGTKALEEMAAAVLILSGAMKLISSIDSDDFLRAIGGITAALGELAGVAVLLDKTGTKSFTSGAAGLIFFASAVGLMAGAAEKFAAIDPDRFAQGLIGVSVALTEFSGAMVLVDRFTQSNSFVSIGTGFTIMAAGMNLLADAVGKFAKLKIEELTRGLIGLSIALFAATEALSDLAEGSSGILKAGAAMVIFSEGLNILASAVEKFAGMDWESLFTGILGFAAATLTATEALSYLAEDSSGILAASAAMVIFSEGLNILASAVEAFSEIPLSNLFTGLLGLAGALTEVVIACKALDGDIGGSATLALAAAGIDGLAVALKLLSTIPLGDMAVAVGGIAGVLGTISLLGPGLTNAAPGVLAVAVGLLALGLTAGGLAKLVLAITAVGAAAPQFTDGVKAMAAVIPEVVATFIGSVIAMIPMALDAIIRGLGQLAEGIVEYAPTIGEAALALGITLCQVLVALATPLGEAAAVAVAGLVYGITKGLEENVDALAAAITMLFSVVAQVVLTLLQNLLGAIPVIGSKISDGLEDVKNDIRASMNPAELENIGITASQSLMNGFNGGLSQPLGGISSVGSLLGANGLTAFGKTSASASFTPVLDMSSFDSIRQGFNSHLSGSFTTKNYTESLGQINLDMSGFDTGNQNVVSGLDTLHDDIQELISSRNNQSVVLSTGELVGALTDRMDASLGKQVNYARRGM